ncbi:MAG: hypothetical protein ABFS56_20115 [Pseudomonadota bacterium]
MALFSTGYLNRFGHPKKERVPRYRRRKISVWDTVPAGATPNKVAIRLNDHPNTFV